MRAGPVARRDRYRQRTCAGRAARPPCRNALDLDRLRCADRIRCAAACRLCRVGL